MGPVNPAQAWLTPLEQKQVELIAADRTYNQIARETGRSVASVHSAATRIRTRLGVHSAAGVVNWAWQHGYLGDRTELLLKVREQNKELTRLNAELSERPRLTAEIERLWALLQSQSEERDVLLNRIDNLELMYRSAVLHKPGGSTS